MHVVGNESDEAVICLECWRRIVDFHTFWKSVILTQSKLLEDKKFSTMIDDSDISPYNAVIKEEVNETEPQLKSNENVSDDIIYDIIVKEEVKFQSPYRFESDEHEMLDYNDRKVDENNHNLFVTDEEELLSLVRGTPRISLPNIKHNCAYEESMDYEEYSVCEENSCNNGEDVEENESKESRQGGDDTCNSNVISSKSTEPELLQNIGHTDDINKSRSIKRKREEELDDIIAQWKKYLNCTVCTEKFTRYTLLQEHFTRDHSDQEFYILCCDIKLKRRAHVAEHVRLHINSNSFKCKYCNKSCTRERNLRYHMLRQHGRTNSKDDSDDDCENSNTATIKEQLDEDKSLLAVREELVIDKTPSNQPNRKLAQLESDDIISKWMSTLECAACKASFKSFTLLHQHFRGYHADGNGYIECCERKFNRRTKFHKHVQTKHLNTTDYDCKLCGKTLSTSLHLKHHLEYQHKIIKHNKNIAQSNVSETLKSKKSVLKRKSVEELDKIIAKWRPRLECEVCNNNESLSFTLLQQHFSNAHPGVKCYISCCKFKFTGRHDIEEHIRYHKNPNAFKCEFCERNFTSKRNLNRHERTKHRS